MNAARSTILLVEDERAQRDALRMYLERQGHEVTAVASGEAALEKLAERSFAVMVTDLRLPGIDGLKLIERAHGLDAEQGKLLITAYASVESAVQALRVGAHDYLLKPLILDEVGRKVRTLLEQRELVRENARLRTALQHSDRSVSLVVRSGHMQAVKSWVDRAARSRVSVLICGETGTGKEVVARNIHALSELADEPFLAVNLAAIPENMVESQLFGHEQGAFTGAVKRREGILRAAGRGTVLLDEIAELAPALQAKLLRALEAREVQPLGSDRTVAFEARLMAATHRDLEAEVAAGRFREDLFYRLNVVRIAVPPLRDRPEDIPDLVRELLARHVTRVGVVSPVVSAAAMRALCRHHWRGNVRELSNVLERALIVADQGRIELEELPEDVRGAEGAGLELQEATSRFERAHISLVLRLCDGSRERAAEELGISPATLYRRIEKLGLKGFEVRRGPER